MRTLLSGPHDPVPMAKDKQSSQLKLTRIIQRINEGYYDSREVAEVIATRLLRERGWGSEK